ncbi:MAG TPA: sn-glycerol-3-phosphate ABC transporter ATP-binding protein UgpC [Gaiellaceae bacterium]
MADIRLDNVSKVYPGGTLAVDGVDLQIEDGSLVVLVGPSGCGKTTLLRMVAGLEEITSGDVSIGGRVVNDVSAKDRDIAMVFQNYALYPHMTVYANMAFGLKFRKLDKDEIKRRTSAAAKTLGLDELLERRPAQLSGGQRQRVAMGRAIVREPAAFLMDEPLSNLDAKLRVQMRAEISRIQRQFDTTTIYVTHDQIEAMTMGDQVAVMRGGVLQQAAPPQGLYANPVNLFVAGFIGSPSMNMVEADLIRSDRGLAVAFGGHVLSLPSSQLERRPALARYEGGRVIVGIRPESLEDASLARSAPEDRRMRVVAELCEAVGPEVYVHFQVNEPPVLTDETRELAAAGGEELLGQVEADAIAARTHFVGRLDPATRAREGEPIELAVDADALHFFDPETGVAV